MNDMDLYVCDSCMEYVSGKNVEIFADYEHVVCKACCDRERAPR